MTKRTEGDQPKTAPGARTMMLENFRPERLAMLQRDAWQISNRYASLKAEILAYAPVGMLLLPINGELRMEPIERMVSREIAHQLAILDDMCRTEIEHYINQALGR